MDFLIAGATIFDYSVTKDELHKLTIYHYTKRDYIENTSSYSRYVDLATLFRMRKEYESFKYYMRAAAEVFEY